MEDDDNDDDDDDDDDDDEIHTKTCGPDGHHNTRPPMEWMRFVRKVD